MVIPVGTGRSESFLIKEEKTVLVDTGASPDIQSFLDLLAEHDTKPEDLSLIIITHGHIDHFAILPELKKMTPAPVLCHNGAAEAITSGISAPSELHSVTAKLLLKLFGLKDPPYNPGLVPEITISSETDLTPYGINGKTILTPGHTDCSISVALENGEAIIGDIILDRPFTGKPGYTIAYVSLEQMKESFRKTAALDMHTFYNAHAKMYTLDKLKRLLQQ